VSDVQRGFRPVHEEVPMTAQRTPLLVRWRADPAKVRVSIRRSAAEGIWSVCVAERATGANVVGWGSSPSDLIDRMLRRAFQQSFDGIDLGLQWSYPHPFRTAEVAT
jgi:hypothetical protein